MIRLPIARLPSDSSRKHIFRERRFVYSLESPHRGDSYEYTQQTIIV